VTAAPSAKRKTGRVGRYDAAEPLWIKKLFSYDDYGDGASCACESPSSPVYAFFHRASVPRKSKKGGVNLITKSVFVKELRQVFSKRREFGGEGGPLRLLGPRARPAGRVWRPEGGGFKPLVSPVRRIIAPQSHLTRGRARPWRSPHHRPVRPGRSTQSPHPSSLNARPLHAR
jgi:hypothetical protein